MKVRIHNEWFMPIKKTTCPCGCKKTQVYAWGQYISARWSTVDYFCQSCFTARVVSRLVEHAGPCGCVFQLQARTGYSLPAWIKMPDQACAA